MAALEQVVSVTFTGSPDMIAGLLAKINGDEKANKYTKSVEATTPTNTRVVGAGGSPILDDGAEAPTGRRKRRTKAEMEAAAKEEEPAEEESEEEAEETEEEDFGVEDEEEAPPVKAAAAKKSKAKTYDLDDIRKGFKSFAEANGREAASKILRKYKVSSVLDLPAQSYPEIMALLKA